MLRFLALLVTPVAVSASAGALGNACNNDTCTEASVTCRADNADAKKCRCGANKVAATSTTCADVTKTSMLAGDIACDTVFTEANKDVAAGDFLENTRCKNSHVVCAQNAALIKETGKCVLLSAVTLGTEVQAGAADENGADGTASAKMWAAGSGDDLHASKSVSGTTKKYLDCAQDNYATASTGNCAAKAGMRVGGACYAHANATVNAATLNGKNMQCLVAAGATSGKLACKADFVDSKADTADACVAPTFKGACDSAAAGTPSATATTTTKNTYALPTGYICPKVAVDAVAGVSEAQAVDKLACAATHVPCHKAGAFNDVTCELIATCDQRTGIRLGGYCSKDTNCTQLAAGNAGITADTGKCRVNASGAKLCSCVKALNGNGTNCLAADTINDAIASSNACYSGTDDLHATVGVKLASLQAFGTGMKCANSLIACDGSFSWDNKTGAVSYGYMLNSDGTGCDKWTGDISKAQACKTDAAYTDFAKNAVCKESKIGCPKTPDTGYTTVCAMNKAMCGKKPSASVKSECQCPYLMHKTTKSDDPDFDEKSCVATVVGAACSATPAETFPASSPSTAYKCSSNKIACQSTYLECKNAGPMKGRCVPKNLIATKTADQTAANLAKKYTLCPTTKAPSTTAAPSSASTLAVSAVAVLATLALA